MSFVSSLGNMCQLATRFDLEACRAEHVRVLLRSRKVPRVNSLGVYSTFPKRLMESTSYADLSRALELLVSRPVRKKLTMLKKPPICAARSALGTLQLE